jgi:FKBP-type peptidyl-prolyl cis-trans isomerase
MKSVVLALTLLALAAPAAAQEPKPAPAEKPAAAAPDKAAPEKKAATEKKATPVESPKTFHSVGLAIAKSLEVFSLSPTELDQVLKGIRDGATGKVKADLDPEQQTAVNELARSRMAKSSEKAAAQNKAQNPAYLAKKAGEKGAIKTESGAIVIPISAGTGASPVATDTVKVHYTGKLVDGKVFDSSVQRGQPAEFPLNGVIKCWTEGLQLMKVGGKAQLVCPPSIAYGSRGAGSAVPPNATLVFEVELIAIQ